MSEKWTTQQTKKQENEIFSHAWEAVYGDQAVQEKAAGEVGGSVLSHDKTKTKDSEFNLPQNELVKWRDQAHLMTRPKQKTLNLPPNELTLNIRLKMSATNILSVIKVK